MFESFCRQLRGFILYCDLFCNRHLLRYKANPEYESLTGGLVTLLMVFIFGIIFTQTIINTFNRTYITSITSSSEETNPSLFTTTASPFLFALGINGLNLNHPTEKYFNVQLYQRSRYSNGTDVRVYHDLVQCSRETWASVDEKFGQAYDKLGFQNWLCLSPSVLLQFQGKFSSDVFKFVKIQVDVCSISGNDTRTCVNSSTLDGNTYSFNYYFVNTIINPDNSEYLLTYLQDHNFFEFTTTLGVSANLYISTYKIITDESLWPLNNYHEDSGGIVTEDAQQSVNNNQEYLQLFLRKSSLSLTIKRSFRKYDDTLSYIGGLFSTILFLMFFMGKFDEYGYEIDMAAKIYRFDRKKTVPTQRYTFLSYLGYCFYCILGFFREGPQWHLMRQFDATRQEVNKQLDLKTIMRQLSFLESCMGVLFEDYELNCLYLKERMTLEEAAGHRRRYSTRERFLQRKKEKQNEQAVGTSSRGSRQPRSDNEESRYSNSIEERAGDEEDQIEQEACDSDISQASEGHKDRLYVDMLASLEELQEQVRRGNMRGQRIYAHLDPKIKGANLRNKKEKEPSTFNQLNNTEEAIMSGLPVEAVETHPVEVSSKQSKSPSDGPDFEFIH